MAPIVCPQCGEADDLAGVCGPDGNLEITCHACGGRDVTSNNPVPGPPDHAPSRRID